MSYRKPCRRRWWQLRRPPCKWWPDGQCFYCLRPAPPCPESSPGLFFGFPCRLKRGHADRHTALKSVTHRGKIEIARTDVHWEARQ